MVRYGKGIAMAMIIGTTALIVPHAVSQSLRQYEWEHRPLLIFAPTSSNEELKRQRKVVSRSLPEFRERDIAVIEVIGSNVKSRLGPSSSATAKALRKHYGVSERQFRAVLVGKDGGSKLRSGRAISAERLLGIIDSMPMRRREMRRGR